MFLWRLAFFHVKRYDAVCVFPCFARIFVISLQVGDRLKTPETPIWVVCSESHYSILFCLDRSILSSAHTPRTAPHAARDQHKCGGEGVDATDSNYLSARSRHVFASSKTDGSSPSKSDETSACSGGKGKRVSIIKSGEETRGDTYKGAVEVAPREEEGGPGAFDLEYYDGLGRQDEVRSPLR